MAVFEELDQLPIAETHGGCGTAALIAVMRVMPEERTLGGLAAFEQRAQRNAVHSSGPDVHRLTERGKEIDARNRRIDVAARLRNAGPADKERFADAAFK